MGDQKAKAIEMVVKRATVNSWIAETDGGSIQWSAE